jgi:hypothetical protein
MSPCGAVGTYIVHRPTTKRLDRGDFERSQITGEAETSNEFGKAFKAMEQAAELLRKGALQSDRYGS